MSIMTYLYFNGNCREAVSFYKEAFQTGEPKILTYGEMPSGGDKFPEAVKSLVLHAALVIAGETVMLSDTSPDTPVTAGSNVCVMANLKTTDQVQAVFDRLKVGGTVFMEVQETFFSSCYAYLMDKYGVSWMLNVESGIE